MLIAVSTPTELAVSTAERAGLTLVALVRGDDYRIFSGPERISEAAAIDTKIAGKNADVA